MNLYCVSSLIFYKTGLDGRVNTIRFDQYLEYQAHPARCCISHSTVIKPVIPKSCFCIWYLEV